MTPADVSAALESGALTVAAAMVAIDAAAATIPATAYHPLYGSRPDATRRDRAARARARVARRARQLRRALADRDAEYAIGKAWIAEVWAGGASHHLLTGTICRYAARVDEAIASCRRRLARCVREAMTGESR